MKPGPPRQSQTAAAKKMRRLRQERIDACRCSSCGQPLGDRDLRADCERCRRHKVAYLAYVRHFLRDFGILYDPRWRYTRRGQRRRTGQRDFVAESQGVGQ
jgi:hypothetical protein